MLEVISWSMKFCFYDYFTKIELKIWISVIQAGIFLRQFVHIVNCFPQ